VTIFNKEEIAQRAKNGIITVTFTKVNGDTRVMKCTLNSSHLPQQMDIEEQSSRQNDSVLAVWDVEANGWRSFKIANVIEVSD